MIKISEGELLDLLPAQLKYDTDMICLSYALKCGMEKLLAYERGTMTANFIDSLPEKILDVLAVELRSPYYSDSMDIETKREVIKNTLVWHLRAGTVSAVSEMVATVFGEGEVVEWWDFDDGEGDPYTFDIVTNARFTEDIYSVLVSIIDRVKNIRSHLRSVKIDRDITGKQYVGSGVISSPKAVVTNNGGDRSGNRTAEGMEYYATGAASSPTIRLGNTLPDAAESLAYSGYTAAGAVSAPNITIRNTMGEAAAGIESAIQYIAAAMSSPKITIN